MIIKWFVAQANEANYSLVDCDFYSSGTLPDRDCLPAQVPFHYFRLALEGFLYLSEKGHYQIIIKDQDNPDNGNLANAISEIHPRIIVTIGSKALTAVAPYAGSVPVISSMVLAPNPQRIDTVAGCGRGVISTVSLEVPLEVLLAKLKQVFPGKTRLGAIVRASVSSAALVSLESRIKKLGFSLKASRCAGGENLLEEFRQLKNAVDFVWIPPDPTLFSAMTFKPIIMASIRNQLPIIGFSKAFVSAGATMGVVADFRDAGLRTAEIMERYLGGQTVPVWESPRRVKVAVNERVVRLIGLRYKPLNDQTTEFLIIR